MKAFDWSHYLTLARFLLNTSSLDKDSNYRNSISRSYYAALNQSKLHAISHQWLKTIDQYNHDNIRTAFINRGSLADVEMYLKRMSRKRNMSDYETELSAKFILEKEARMVYSEAEKVFEILLKN